MAFLAEINGLFIDRQNGEPVVVLKEKDGGRTVPIWIRMNEMFSLAVEMSSGDYRPPRPFSHDLIKTIVHNLHARVRQALICEIKDHVYHAKLTLTAPKTALECDARPSDAILMALKFDAPIIIEEHVAQQQLKLLEEAGLTMDALIERLQAFRPEDFVNLSAG